MSQENMDVPTTSETKVFYYLDDNADPNTPIVMKVPVAPDEITLADFMEHFAKKQLKCGQKTYQYFCKSLDPDIQEDVKIELTQPTARLKRSKRGIFEIHLSSVGYGTLSRAGTLPRKGNQIEKERRRRSAELDGLHYDFGNMPGPNSYVPSSKGTVFSRRAGEHLADMYTSNSEDPYRFEESSRMSSSIYEPLPPHRAALAQRRKPRNQRYRKAYVPSTKGSATESSMSSGQVLEQVVDVNINMEGYDFLGINVGSMDGNIFITKIFPGTAAYANGKLEVGDQIVQVNHQSFQHIDVKEAISLLKKAAVNKKSVLMYVAKQPKTGGGYDPLAEIASETLPLDIALWVQSAAQCSARDQQKRMNGMDDTQQSSMVTFTEGTMHHGETDDEEERQLYDQRRNGIPQHVLEEREMRRENEQNEHRLVLRSDMDPARVVQAMARPSSGLLIKDRKWLKLPVPQAFLGKDLVNWLLANVEDLRDKKAAKQFASMLLERGLICHYVTKHSFAKTCYYVFGDAIVSARGAAESTQNSGGTLRAEATTEVTYVGSPAPAGIRQLRNPLHPIPNRYDDQIWPISPIANDKNGRPFRRTDCESTFTNEYASMVGVDSAVSYAVGINNGYSRHPPPNTPLSGGGSLLLGQLAPPHPSPCETEFEDDDKRRMIKN